MDVLLSIPILITALILQTTIVSRITLIGGTADIILIILAAWGVNSHVKSGWAWAVLAGAMVTFVSAMPLFVPFIAYMVLMFIARQFQKRIWQSPILATLFIVFISTLIQHGLSILVLQISGANMTIMESFEFVTLPSLILNLLLTFPIYTIMNSLARQVYRVEDDL
ncbi:MAG TPA: rod shape-determining protein MreD [Longilinea sp.]|nr:rod shape-determining protein MreD [Longilinea sp.]